MNRIQLQSLIRECIREVLNEAASQKSSKSTKSTPKLKKCDYCWKRKPDVRRQTDPYQEEINNDYTLYNLCDDCAGGMADAI